MYINFYIKKEIFRGNLLSINNTSDENDLSINKKVKGRRTVKKM